MRGLLGGHHVEGLMPRVGDQYVLLGQAVVADGNTPLALDTDRDGECVDEAADCTVVGQLDGECVDEGGCVGELRCRAPPVL